MNLSVHDELRAVGLWLLCLRPRRWWLDINEPGHSNRVCTCGRAAIRT